MLKLDNTVSRLTNVLKEAISRQQFHVPPELLESWRHLSSIYRDYLPELQMEPHSFIATANEAEAIFQQLREMNHSPEPMHWAPRKYLDLLSIKDIDRAEDLKINNPSQSVDRRRGSCQ